MAKTYMEAVWGDAVDAVTLAMATAARDSIKRECVNASEEVIRQVFCAASAKLVKETKAHAEMFDALVYS